MDILTEDESEKSMLKMTATGRSNSVGTRKATIFLHRYLLFIISIIALLVIMEDTILIIQRKVPFGISLMIIFTMKLVHTKN